MLRRTPIGRRARRRKQAGALRALGRPAASVVEWKAIRQQVLARADWRCQACGVRRRLDVHHVVKRSQGGSDFDLDQLVALCRWCHDKTDAPYERGRLVVIALGADQFTFEVVQRPGRGTPQARVPRFAHVGKVQPFEDDCDSGDGPFSATSSSEPRGRAPNRFADVGKTTGVETFREK